MVTATPSCFRLLAHWLRRACSLARAKTGKRMAARMAMMAITTSNSIRVKPRCCLNIILPPLIGRAVRWFSLCSRGTASADAIHHALRRRIEPLRRVYVMVPHQDHDDESDDENDCRHGSADLHLSHGSPLS